MKGKNVLQAIGGSIEKNAPTLLIAAGLSSLVGAIVMAVEATPKAMKVLEDERNDIYALPADVFDSTFKQIAIDNNGDVLTKKDIVKLTLPIYLPTIGTATLGVVAILAGNRIHLRRAAALTSLYTLTEDALRTYQEKVTKKLGEDKAGTIRNDILDDETSVKPPKVIHNQGGGHELCYEGFTGRYFWSTANQIKSVVNKFNEELLQENRKSFNEFAYDLGLPSVEFGDLFGWDIDDGLVDVYLGSKLTEEEHPCILIDHINRPRYFNS